MRYWLVIVAMLAWCQPAGAFIEQLHSYGGDIPCHVIGAIFRDFATPGGPSGATLAGLIEAKYVPGGWTAQDLTDNAAVAALINAQGMQADKDAVVQRLEDYCILAEEGFAAFDTPAKYRTRLGL